MINLTVVEIKALIEKHLEDYQGYKLIDITIQATISNLVPHVEDSRTVYYTGYIDINEQTLKGYTEADRIKKLLDLETWAAVESIKEKENPDDEPYIYNEETLIRTLPNA